ncbi:MAG TPA: cytochrome b N-terminal domain-containing protein [bacterium]|nr:cytochrome b N-terminal domain-containing protein [bacterium]
MDDPHGRKRLAGLRESQLWRSMFRTGVPDRPRRQVAVVLSSVFLHVHPARVPRESLRLRRTWCLGGLSALAFVVLTVTGALLMFHYRPVPELAYADIQDLSAVVPYGALLRNAHRWAGHAMVLLVIAHLARVFLTGAYRPPREFNWVVGVLLLVATLFLSFTGYLLPWDQLAYWAVTVGTNMAAAAPVVGHEGPLAVLGEDNDVRALLLGGRTVGAAALLRFYVLHCIVVPAGMLLLMAVHFYRVRRDGGVLSPRGGGL